MERDEPTMKFIDRLKAFTLASKEKRLHSCKWMVVSESEAEKLLAFIDAYDDWEENGGFYAQPGERLSNARSALDKE